MTAITTPFRRTPTTLFGYWILSYYTLLQASVSVLMPFLRSELNLTYAQAGLYMSANALGMVLSGLTGDRLANRFNRRALTWAGAFGTILGSLLLIFGKTVWLTLAGVFINGLAGGIAQVMIQAVLADLHGERQAVALTEGNITASLGSLAAPLLVSAAVTLGLGWRASPMVALGLLALSTWIFWRAPFPSPSLQTDAAGQPNRLTRKYWLIWIVLFLCVSVEWSVIFWSADFLEKIAGFSKTAAATAMGAYFLGSVLGRVSSSRLVRRFRPFMLLLWAIVLGIAGTLLFWLAPLPALRLVGLFMDGLGIGSLYPLGVVEAVGAAPGAVNTGSARATLAAGSAIFSAPLLLGWVADFTGIRGAYGLTLLLLAAAGTLAFAVYKTRE
jgi:predicted MFS family arabinose efflux permease